MRFRRIPVAFLTVAGRIDEDTLVLEQRRKQLTLFGIPRLVRIVNEFLRALANQVAKNKLREIADNL